MPVAKIADVMSAFMMNGVGLKIREMKVERIIF